MAIKKGDLKRLGNFFLFNRKETSEETTEKFRKTKKETTGKKFGRKI